MKRIIALIIPLIIAVVVVVPVLFSQSGFPDTAQAALNKYLLYRGQTASELVRARQPENFSLAMSAFTIGESARYRTGYAYQATTVSTLLTSGMTSLSTIRADNNSRMSLPFPPEAVWCVRLTQALPSTGSATVFVAFHQDLYNGAWIVHEPPGNLSDAQHSTMLADVSCQLRVEP